MYKKKLILAIFYIHCCLFGQLPQKVISLEVMGLYPIYHLNKKNLYFRPNRNLNNYGISFVGGYFNKRTGISVIVNQRTFKYIDQKRSAFNDPYVDVILRRNVHVVMNDIGFTHSFVIFDRNQCAIMTQLGLQFTNLGNTNTITYFIDSTIKNNYRNDEFKSGFGVYGGFSFKYKPHEKRPYISLLSVINRTIISERKGLYLPFEYNQGKMWWRLNVGMGYEF